MCIHVVGLAFLSGLPGSVCYMCCAGWCALHAVLCMLWHSVWCWLCFVLSPSPCLLPELPCSKAVLLVTKSDMLNLMHQHRQ